VRKYLREVQTGPDDATAVFEEISPHIDDLDEAILSDLEELPLSSVRSFQVQLVYRRLRYTGDSLRNSGSSRVITDEYRRFDRTIASQDGSNVQRFF
jgi:hypothetical protein